MVRRMIRSPKALIITPLLLALAFIIACGGSATSAPDATGEAPTPTLFTSVTGGEDTQATPVTGGGATPVPDATEESEPAVEIKRGGIVPMHAYAASDHRPAAA